VLELRIGQHLVAADTIEAMRRDARFLENVLFYDQAIEARGLEDTVGVPGIQVFFARFYQEANGLHDPVETVLLKQLALAHLMVSTSYARATASSDLETKHLHTDAAVRFVEAICSSPRPLRRTPMPHGPVDRRRPVRQRNRAILVRESRQTLATNKQTPSQQVRRRPSRLTDERRYRCFAESPSGRYGQAAPRKDINGVKCDFNLIALGDYFDEFGRAPAPRGPILMSPIPVMMSDDGGV